MKLASLIALSHLALSALQPASASSKSDTDFLQKTSSTLKVLKQQKYHHPFNGKDSLRVEYTISKKNSNAANRPGSQQFLLSKKTEQALYDIIAHLAAQQVDLYESKN